MICYSAYFLILYISTCEGRHFSVMKPQTILRHEIYSSLNYYWWKSFCLINHLEGFSSDTLSSHLMQIINTVWSRFAEDHEYPSFVILRHKSVCVCVCTHACVCLCMYVWFLFLLLLLLETFRNFHLQPLLGLVASVHCRAKE